MATKSASRFKVGDIVKLKSGGPDMSVNALDVYGNVHCTWFSGKKNERASFNQDVLEPVGSGKSES